MENGIVPVLRWYFILDILLLFILQIYSFQHIDKHFNIEKYHIWNDYF